MRLISLYLLGVLQLFEGGKDEMKAYVKTKREYGALEFKDVPKPEPKADEVLIKIRASAICGSDLHAYEYPAGYEFMSIPVTLGHEYSGVVEKIGSEVTLFNVGDFVMGESNQYCGNCGNCHEGRTNICDNNRMTGLHIDGAMAEYIAVPEKMLHRIPQGVSFEEAALAQPCAVSFHGMFDKSDVRPGDSVVVFGPGIVGLMAAKGAQLMGASQVFVVGTDMDAEVRLPLAEKMGFIVINADQEDLSQKIVFHTGKDKVDVAVECSGAASACKTAMDSVRKGGSISLLGIYSRPSEIFFTPLIRQEIQLHTSYTCGWKNYEQALRLIASGQLDLKPLISTYPFEEGMQAIQDGLDKKVLKPVLLLKE